MLLPNVRSTLAPNRTVLVAALLLLVCGALFFWQLDGYTLFNVTEAKQAEIARQIWVRQDWITPVYNGDRYFDKPILLHWLIALGFPIFGLNEWAVRIPSALSATGLVIATWLFTAVFANARTAVLAAVIIAANPFTFAIGRTGQHDMLLVCFMTAALYCWYLGYSTRKPRHYLAFFALLALAFMAKGPLALVLCGLIIGVFVTAVGRWKDQFTSIPWIGSILVFAGISLPWYLLVIYANGWGFIDYFFGYSNVDRFINPNLNQIGPWWYYLPMVVVGFFPWVVVLPNAAVAILRTRKLAWLKLGYWRKRSPRQQVTLFMVIWFAIVLLFMSSAATKLPWYVYPGLPALAYLCAQAWDQQLSMQNRGFRLSLQLIAVIYLGMAIAFVLLPDWLPSIPAIGSIQASGAPVLLGVTYLLTAVAIAVISLQRQIHGVWQINLAAFGVLSLILINQIMPILDQEVLGGRLLPIAAALQQETCDTCSNDAPAALGIGEPSLNFYSGISTIKRFEGPFQATQVRLQLLQPQRLLLVTTEAALQQAYLDLSQYQPAYAANGYKVFIFPANLETAQGE